MCEGQRIDRDIGRTTEVGEHNMGACPGSQVHLEILG